MTSTLNIQHLESLNDVVERITGIKQRETIPDEIVRAAEQVELVDITPEALRRRMVHGNIYAPDKIDASLANYFRAGNLGALRELALLWVADKVDVGLEEYRERHGITKPWETRERVVVAVTGAPGTEALIRRAARIAQRAHGELLGVHVSSDEGLAGPTPSCSTSTASCSRTSAASSTRWPAPTSLPPSSSSPPPRTPPSSVLGASHRSRWEELAARLGDQPHRPSLRADRRARHLPRGRRAIPTVDARLARLRRLSFSPVSPRRQLAGWLLAAVGDPAADGVPRPAPRLDGAADGAARLPRPRGDRRRRRGNVAGARRGDRLVPVRQLVLHAAVREWTIAEGENVVALFVFLGIALGVSRIVDTAARRATEAARPAATPAPSPGWRRRPATMIRCRRCCRACADFALDAVAVLRRDGDDWVVEAAVGEPAITARATRGGEGVEPGVVLALDGPNIPAEDLLILNAFADQLAAVLEHGRLRVEAGRAQPWPMPTSCAARCSRRCRTTCARRSASIKACATSLDNRDVHWSEEETAEFVNTIDTETDRIARRPERVLVDELAHTNVPGSRNEKRWEDVEELLDAGIDVTSTLNIQHLESLNDVVEGITGIKQRETIPDEIVRAAEQVEMVDITPEALRRRMVHGNIYAPDKIDSSLGQLLSGWQPRRVA